MVLVTVLVYLKNLRGYLKNPKIRNMKGREAKLYAIRIGSGIQLKYIASITQMMLIIIFFFVLKTNVSTSNLR
jgi:hypothetical protein